MESSPAERFFPVMSGDYHKGLHLQEVTCQEIKKGLRLGGGE